MDKILFYGKGAKYSIKLRRFTEKYVNFTCAPKPEISAQISTLMLAVRVTRHSCSDTTAGWRAERTRYL